MQQFKAAIFDMDGLLIDSEVLAFETFRQTAIMHDLGDRDELFRQLLGTNHDTGQALLREGLGDDELYNEFDASWTTLYAAATTEKPVPLKPGVIELLKHCKQLGLFTAVATSTHTEHAVSRLEASGIHRYFHCVVGGDQVTRSKPEPDIYQYAAKRVGTDVNECIAFEDSKNGVRAAIAAGMTVVQIPDLVQPDNELLQLGPIVLSNLHEVITYPFT